jgi:hypothetical protein
MALVVAVSSSTTWPLQTVGMFVARPWFRSGSVIVIERSVVTDPSGLRIGTTVPG